MQYISVIPLYVVWRLETNHITETVSPPPGISLSSLSKAQCYLGWLGTTIRDRKEWLTKTHGKGRRWHLIWYHQTEKKMIVIEIAR